MSSQTYPNILDPDFYAKGHHQEQLMALRKSADAPVIKIDDPLTDVPYWVILNRDDADFVCKNPQLFSSTRRSAIPTEFDDDAVAAQADLLLNMDPPKHQKYRRIARNAFTPKAVDSYHKKFSDYAKSIVDVVAKRGECEFVADVAAELPLMVILDICGVPQSDRKQIFHWTNEIFFRDDEDFNAGMGHEKAAEAAGNLFMYADQLAKKHELEPLTNIVGALLDGTVEDEKLTAYEFQMFFMMLISAGNESTRSVTTHGLRLLMEHPEQLQMLVDDPTLIPGAVEEILRYNPAFICMRRTATEDVELGGQTIKAGDKVILNWHLINLDENVFDEPLRFDITRAQRMPNFDKEHRAFSIGQHFCLGAHLARLELNIIFSELVPRLRNPRFAAPVQYVRDYFVNGIKEMRIRFDAQ